MIYLGALSQLSVYTSNTYVVGASTAFIDLLRQRPPAGYPFRDLIKERAIAELLDSGELWLRVKEVRRKKLGEKEDLEYNLKTILGHHIRIVPSTSGLSLWILFSADIDLRQLMQRLQDKKIPVPYDPAQEIPLQPCHQMRLGFGTYSRDEALDAAAVLRKLLESPGQA